MANFGTARYLFKKGALIAKEENKYIEQDFSHLISRADEYKTLAEEFVRRKFNN